MTTTRMTKKVTLSEWSFVLVSADVAVQGHRACLDTSLGQVRMGTASTTLIPIGTFAEGLTGDGTKKIRVTLDAEIQAERWDNDTGTAVATTDIGSECYLLDSHTVTMASSGHSKGGRVLDVDTDLGVLVQAGSAVTGPTGASAGSAAQGGVATRAALTAIAAGSRFDGMVMLVRSDNSLWRFNSSASFTSDENQQLGCTPDAGSGRWVRVDKTFTAKLRFTKDTADAAALLTVPTGFAIRLIGQPYWDVVTGFTGGTNSAIGVSASAIATTKGDLLGGASGQLTAVLGTAGIKAGTIGPLIDTLAEIQAFFLKAADYLRADLIASQYAAGDGYACFPIAVEIVGAQT
jgi:hypothetical protein